LSINNYELPKGYKQTEVGVIPEDWDVQPLAQVASLDVGYAFKSSWYRRDIGIPLLRGENVGYGSPEWSDTRRLSEQDAKLFSTYLLHPGDIVIGMDRTFTKSGTKISLLQENDCPCLLVQRVGRFVPLACSASFLWALLSSPKFQSSLQLEQKGMDIPHLSRSEILQPYVALPPTNVEQEAIAATLSDVDALIAALDNLIAKQRHLKTATMQQLLTGKKRLPGFSGEWIVQQLGEISEIVMGQSPSSLNYNLKGEGLPLIQGNADIVERQTIKRVFTLQITKLGKSGDILMTVRAPVGQISQAKFDICLGRGVCALRFPNTFLYHFLISIESTWAKHSKGSTFDSVNSSDISAIKVNLPSDAQEQRAIATVLSDMDAAISALETRRAKTQAIKQGMMQELLTGKTRLINNE
jgi:type I restriction enzyme S subunit